MQAVRGAPGDVLILVGPEGGFADEEVEEARRLGATAVSLGPTRLRSETAAIVAAVLAVASLTTDV
jgi:16S rRNA (uracil1498-N3)-methyltransferase